MHKFFAATLAAAVITGITISGVSLSSAEAEDPSVGSPGVLSGNQVSVPGVGSPGTGSGNVVGGLGLVATASEATHLTLTGVTAAQLADFKHESFPTTAGPWTYHDEVRRAFDTQQQTYWAYFELPNGITAHDLSATMSVDTYQSSVSESVSASNLGPYVMLRWTGVPDDVTVYGLDFRLVADGYEISDTLDIDLYDRGSYRIESRDTQYSSTP
jgi:hypothetical protein